MNNSKKTLVAGAGAGVLALAMFGGGTFAAWSDFQTVTGNTVGADTLRLEIGDTLKFDDVKLAPGQARDTAVFVASRTGVSTPDAYLTATLQNLVGHENGCDSNSERQEDGDCNDTATGGEFTTQALYYVQSKVVDSPEDCDSSNMPTALGNTLLSEAQDVKVPLGNLAAGEGVCVQAQVFMPDSVGQYGHDADNRSQGDWASFDIRFDLTQITPNHPQP
jgi:predicted ribosomally synthesized peptide with SipW-like signal peptide